jgi:phosphoglycolate phosphatase
MLMKSTDIQAVVFDFDYTLADSSKGAVDCINFALEGMGLSQVSAEAACRTIGSSLKDTFLALGEHHESQRCEEFSKLFVQRADQVMSNLTVLYESVPSTVEALRKRDLRLGIVSTKFRYRIEEIESSLQRLCEANINAVVVGPAAVRRPVDASGQDLACSDPE